ncbi:unnamed protein product, partial [Cladocopium goreaui]
MRALPWLAASLWRNDGCLALPFSEKYSDLEREDLARVAHALLSGRLNCSATGREAHVLDMLRHYGGVPDSCFAANLGRVLCCTSLMHSPCFEQDPPLFAFSAKRCCSEVDPCLLSYEAVTSQATFDCGDFLRCAGAIFLPCLTWTMEEDRYFETILAPRLLQRGHRCFSLSLSAPSSDVPVLGLDFWLLGLCAPAVCSAESIEEHAEELVRYIHLASVTGMRAVDINDLNGVAVQEIVHWSQLRLDFAIVGPPNSGSSSLQKSLGAHPDVRFIGGLDEMSVPSSWLRSVESWHWRCSAPQLLPKSWAVEHHVEVLAGNEAGEIVSRKRSPIVGFRNPKFIYSKQCLENLKFIPGIKIIAMWRDPIDWMWSSLSRAYEGFDASHEDFVQAWHALAVDAGQ